MFARLIPLARYGLILAGVTLFAIACGASAPPAPSPTGAPSQPSLPDTEATALMNYLQSVNYQNNWELWPGKGEKYEGPPPHGMLLTTYLNEAAFNALTGNAESLPDGSIIVKENYTPEGVLDATTVMYKVSGYNPEHNDWFWTKIAADGTVQEEGKVEGCQTCHGQQSDNDYILTSPLN
jgi:hypothetical protein